MRRWHVVALAVLGVFALACEEGTGTADPKPTGGSSKSYPSSMAALGDSITAGYASCFALIACERRSWSTGSDAAVDSTALREASLDRIADAAEPLLAKLMD